MSFGAQQIAGGSNTGLSEAGDAVCICYYDATHIDRGTGVLLYGFSRQGREALPSPQISLNKVDDLRGVFALVEGNRVKFLTTRGGCLPVGMSKLLIADSYPARST